jgi:signal transduction histidine kinase/CheY-like chemotaxis protein
MPIKLPPHDPLDETTSRSQLIEELALLRRQLDKLSRENTALRSGMRPEAAPPGETEIPKDEWLAKARLLTALRDIEPYEKEVADSRKQSLELAHHKELLQGLFDNLPVMLVMWDPRLQRFTLNRHAETVLGWTTSDANDGDFMRKVYPDDAYRAQVVEYMQSLEPGWKEWHAAAKNGERVPSVWANIRLTDETMIGIGVDLRERKQVLHALQESENNFRVALRNSAFIPSRFDRELRYQWIYNSHPDFDSMDVVGKRDDELDDSDATKRLTALKRQVLETGVEVRAEVSFERSDGTRIYDMILEPLRDASGIVVGGTCIAFDITDRKLAEEALRKSEERLRLAIDSAYLISFEWDIVRNEVHRFASKDPALPVTLERSGTFEDVLNAVHPEDRDRFTANVSAAVEQGDGRYENEFRIVHPNGKLSWLHESGFVERDVHNRPIRLIGLSQDITARKQAELGLQQLNETLEQQVAERTALAESRARQLQTLAVELIEAEERERQRIAELLHEDLQQILAGARYTLQSTRCADPDLEQVQRLLEESIRKSKHLSQELSPTVLHYSNLSEALEWLCRKMRDQFGLDAQLDETPGRPVKSAPLKTFLFRSAQELLFNIVKHAEVNTARVKLSGSDVEFCLTVSDPGKGFDPSILKTPVPKSGLGILSLRERASYVGGSLIIESAPGQGSRITLSVPASMDALVAPYPAPVVVKDKPHRPAHTDFKIEEPGIRVIFADDHKVMRQGLIRLISGQPDIEVVGQAANGREALELTRQFIPNLVVMDISMPEMDGIEATRRIKAEMPQVRVIGLSMFEDEQAAREMHTAGADGFVIKTASAAELLKAIYGIDDGRTS